MRWIIRVGLLLTAVAAAAQVRETVTVSVVEVPVTVVDGSGSPVRGLTQQNFKLFDNGKEVQLTSFDTIDFANDEALQATSPMNPAARRNFMLLFDLSFSKPGNLARAQDAARAFVAKAVGPRDLIGVGTIDTKRGFSLLAAFTSDRQLVQQAIAHPGEQVATNDPLHLANEGINVEASEGKRGGGTTEAIVADSAKLSRQNVQAQAEHQMDFLGELARTLRAIPGRKQLIFLSEGFDPRFLQGQDARESFGSDDPRANAADTDVRYGSNSSTSALQRMAKLFRGSDVLLHTLDIQGIRGEADVTGGFGAVNSSASLSLLSEPTGGMAFRNVNNIDENFKRVLRSQEVVYVLAFRAPAAKPGQFHDLKVKLVNVPGSAKAFNRAGYYEGGSQTAQERAFSNAEIIMNDIPQEDLKVSSVTASFAGSTEKAQVPVILEIDGSDLMKDVKGNTTDAEIYIYAFDSDGTVRDRAYQKMSLDLKKVGDKLRGSGIKYFATLSLPPGKYAVKALVRVPETERKGFARSDVTVARPGELVVYSPIFVEEQPRWLMVKGASHDPGAAYPFELNGQQFIPATGAHVRDGSTKRFAVLVQNPPADDLTFDANQQVKFLGRTKSGSATAFVMELSKLDPSAVSLDVTVHRKGAGDLPKISVALGQQ